MTHTVSRPPPHPVVTRSPRGRPVVKALDITVLAGGPSDEREVSLASGRAVHDALIRLGHQATLADISPDDLTALDIPADCVFIALHGAFGEDGQVQRLLEQTGRRYCGCDAASSALAMDKVESKKRFLRSGIPTAAFQAVDATQVETVRLSLEPPVVVKPVDSGSSVDTYIVREQGKLREVLRTTVGRHGSALVERYIDGLELTVGVLGGRPLPVLEIRPKRAFYDYQAKYVDDDTEYLFDIPLPDSLLEQVQELSLRAERALRCREFCRVDWMVDRRTHEPFLLEINTIPGFTSHSLLPKAAARAGISFDELCQRIVTLAMRRDDA